MNIKKILKYLFTGLFVSILLSGCGATINSLAKKGDFNAAKEKIDAGTNINKIDEYGYTQLLYAAKTGNIKVMKDLINNGADINFKASDDTHPIYNFVSSGYDNNLKKDSLDMIKWMIGKGADYKEPSYNKYTLIHISKDIELTKYLISLGMKVGVLTENNATTLMGSVSSPLNDKLEDTTVQEYLINQCVDLEQMAIFGSEKLNAIDVAKYYKRYKALELINDAIKNPPRQCWDIGMLATNAENELVEEMFRLNDNRFIFYKANFIFLNIKDKIKKHLGFTDSKGRHLIMFDFYGKNDIPRVVKKIDTEKIDKIYMADRGDWYRVTFRTKTKQSYKYIIHEKGVYIKLKNIKSRVNHH
ncbi:MAG: ankyrin repeat domain-containing protein [Arcobacteraceae bacterium]|nr:ankyrin repeat domain-containing protein [Arcobacteraceae bacterium]